MHFQGASNINCSTVVFIVDVCRFSQPFSSNKFSNTYGLTPIMPKFYCEDTAIPNTEELEMLAKKFSQEVVVLTRMKR